MESIEQMIKRLCPKGVEYVTLGDLFELRNGYTPSKGNVDFWTLREYQDPVTLGLCTEKRIIDYY